MGKDKFIISCHSLFAIYFQIARASGISIAIFKVLNTRKICCDKSIANGSRQSRWSADVRHKTVAHWNGRKGVTDSIFDFTFHKLGRAITMALCMLPGV